MAEAAPGGHSEGRFLPDLVKAVQAVSSQGAEAGTKEFTELIDRIELVFGFLGAVMGFAKSDIHTKNASLKAAMEELPLLSQIVAADRAAGTLTVRNSRARNLHRLMGIITFMRLLLQKLMEGPGVTVREAASLAYEKVLAPIHPLAIRTAVWAGMYMLPSRAAFMAHIQENDESAQPLAEEFMRLSEPLVVELGKLYEGTQMPAAEAPGGEEGKSSGARGWFGMGK